MIEDLTIWEQSNGDWSIDYQIRGNDYRVTFAGPDAELRAIMYSQVD